MERKDKELQIRGLVDRLGRPPIAMLDEEIAWHGRRKSYRRAALGILVSLVAAVAVIIIVTNLWVAVLQVDGSSMNPALRMNEIVLVVRKSNSGRNDVVALTRSDKAYIKRVIAVSGDQVDIREDGTVSVNGEALREPYVAEQSLGSCDIGFPFQVPPGTVFVLGDNRASSMDSRDSRFGTIAREQIVGRVVCRIWPLKRLGRIS